MWLVPDRPARPGRAFVVLLVGILAAGLVGLLVLNTAMQRNAFRLQALTEQADAAEVRRQVLALDVEGLRSPEVLGRRAAELGMVPMGGPAFLRLPDGKVLGNPAPAVAGTGPVLVPAAPPDRAPDPAERGRGDAPGDTRGDTRGDDRGDDRGDTRGDTRGDSRGGDR